MCIPHGITSTRDNGYIEDKPKKHVQKISKEQFERGDPNFKDERTKPYIKKEKHSFFSDLFK